MTATRVCALSELEQDSAIRVEVDGVAIAVVRDSNDEVHAIGDVCTHGDISLSEGFVEDDSIECWAHGARFSLTTGRALSYPAFLPVPVYPVEIVDGDVYVGKRIP